MFIITRILFALFLCIAMPLHAQLGEWQHHEAGDLRLIASSKASDDGALYAALHLKLNPRWHTYWRSPGDAGLAPSPNWKDSTNLDKAELLFPYPHRYDEQGLTTNGYEGEVVFPVRITKKDAAAALGLNAKITLLVCSDICVPADYTVALNVPADAAGDDEAAALIKTALAKVPKLDDGQGLSILSATLSGQELTLLYTAPTPLADVDVLGEVGDGSTLPYSNKQHDAQARLITVQLTKDAPTDLGGKDIIFTLIDVAAQTAVEKKITVMGAAPIVVAAPVPAPNLWVMVLFALMGGFILNLMPCVFPVLALKALSFISHGGGTASGVRLSFLATSAGILFSFLVMAGIIIGLKDVGMSVGWGVQFQNPVFLIFLITILLLFAVNLFGLFEIPLPRFLADRLSWTQGHGSLAKDFFSGAFATLLATPCTAPFLGTAVGFALAGGWVEILSIFIGLGLGLASPFLLIALFPKLATLLPKPGAWMEHVRKFLAVLLTLTALWLGVVLYNQIVMPKHEIVGQWDVFDEKKIPELIAQGKIVFVDVTADWCLTCQANKKFVLETAEVEAMFANPRIVRMVADWTSRDETIGAYLKTFMRYGIPFNVIYSAAQPQGAPLPELLSKDAIREGLAKAGL